MQRWVTANASDLLQMAAFMRCRVVGMVFGKNSPLQGERVQWPLTHGDVHKQPRLVAIRGAAGDVPFTPKPKIMERTEWKGWCFPSTKLLTLPTVLQPTSHGIPLHFLEISKCNTHLCFILMQAPVWVLHALLRIVIFLASINFSSCYQKIFKYLRKRMVYIWVVAISMRLFYKIRGFSLC